VIMSTDSKVTQQRHDAYTFERVDETVVETGDRNEKVHAISDSVLLFTAGIMETSVIFENEIIRRIKPEYTLEQCAEILHTVTIELWERRKSYSEGGAEDKDALALNFIGTEDFTCCMYGFLSNGKTGSAYINPETITVELT